MSVAEHLNLQKKALENSFNEQLRLADERYRELEDRVQQKNASAGPETSLGRVPETQESRAACSEDVMGFLAGLHSKVKLERVQLLKKIHMYFREFADSHQLRLEEQVYEALLERCSLAQLEKVSAGLAEKFKLTSLFNSTLERLPAPNTRPIINQLEATLHELILRVNESMDELRRMWNKRLKKILEQKNEPRQFMEDKACQASPAFAKSANSAAQNNSITPFPETTEAPERSSLLISNFNERAGRKGSIKSATCAANLFAQFEQSRYSETKPTADWGFKRSRPADQPDLAQRKSTEPSRAIDRESLSRSPSIVIEMPVGRRVALDPSPIVQKEEHSPLLPPSLGLSQPKPSSNFSLVLDDTAVNQSQEARQSRKEKDRSIVRASKRIDEYEDWQVNDESKRQVMQEFDRFKKSSEQQWQFNPCLEILYQDPSNQMSKYFGLKRLGLEAKFLKDSMLAEHVISEAEQLISGLGTNKKLVVYVRKATRGLLRLWQKTFTENRIVLDFLRHLSKITDPALLIESMNEESFKLKKEYDEFGVLFEAYRARENLKQTAIESCSRFGQLGSLKAYAMLTSVESDSIIEIDDEIQALVEGLEQIEVKAPYYRGCDIRELIEFDLWEIDRLKKARKRGKSESQVFYSSRRGPL